MSFQHILAPTDFSALSNGALSYAFREAELHSATLTLMHVLQHHANPEVHYIRGGPEVARGMTTELGATIPATPVMEPVVVRRDYVEEADRQLRELIPVTFSQPYEVRVEYGDPADAIVRAAEELDSDLIVMVTHGRTGLSHVLLGSVAEKVIRHAPCPVLAIRRRAVAA